MWNIQIFGPFQNINRFGASYARQTTQKMAILTSKIEAKSENIGLYLYINNIKPLLFFQDIIPA